MHRVALVFLVTILVAAGGGGGSGSGAPVGWLTPIDMPAGCLAWKPAAGCGRYVGVAQAELGAAVVVSADGHTAYVADGTTLATFRRSATGALEQLSGAAGCVQDPSVWWYSKRCASLVDFWPHALALSPDGRTLYVAAAAYDYGGGKTDEWTRLDAFAVDRGTGALRRITQRGGCFGVFWFPTKGCLSGRGTTLPLSVAVSRDGANVYVESYGGYSGSGGTAVFGRSAAGTLSQLPGSAGCLLAERGTPRCSARPRRKDWPVALVVSPDGTNVYVSLSTTLHSFARSARTGALTPLPGSAGVRVGVGGALAISPDGRTVYVEDGAAIVTLVRRAGGRLDRAGAIALPRPGAPSYGWPAIAVSPDGRSVYVADGGVEVFARDTRTGALSFLQCLAHTTARGCDRARSLTGASGVAVSPDGRNVYVVGDTITAYRRASATSARLRGS